MNKLLQKYLMGSRFAGIEAELRESDVLFHTLILKRAGNKIVIEKIAETVNTLSEPAASMLKNVPLILTFTGKGVLYRHVQADPDSSVDVLLRKVLPNVSADDFLVSVVHDESSHFVSVIRKSTLMPVLNEISKYCAIIHFDVGAAAVADAAPLIGPQRELRSGTHLILLGNKSVASIAYGEPATSEKITIGTDTIPGDALIAFAAAFRYIANTGSALRNFSPEAGKEDFVQHRFFRFLLKHSLVACLVILLGNFFAFSHYRSLAAELQSMPESGTYLSVQPEVLRNQVETRTMFLENAGLLNTTSFAWCADQLAHGMPPGIQLTQMNFSPRLKLAEEDSIGFSPNQVVLSGTCEESIVLNRWLQSLNAQAWVSSATIRTFQQSRPAAKGEFVLDLTLQ